MTDVLMSASSLLTLSVIICRSIFSVLPAALSQTVKHKTLETNQSYMKRSGRTESYPHTALFSRVQRSDTPLER